MYCAFLAGRPPAVKTFRDICITPVSSRSNGRMHSSVHQHVSFFHAREVPANSNVDRLSQSLRLLPPSAGETLKGVMQVLFDHWHNGLRNDKIIVRLTSIESVRFSSGLEGDEREVLESEW